ncbi:SnoaL-like domain-containing protein [Raineyella antarctica]|uniref:SnoaL-like domain-containing protein n=1 Tax=Raineyella antarctica TaxID=1577474 RepID=A0A1G6HSY7_9ACTN|nr:nuclear transport factor 2 family protein [Raineyella antarctica]SDB97304.1 SnoaL-like domain-containing protein [Raineyella antarctica]
MSHITQLPQTLARLVSVTNAHDIDGLVGCFAPDYELVMPNHPARDFTGTEQVRRNWTMFFTQIPDITTSITRVCHDAGTPDEWWTEWEMRGTRSDGTTHLMRGVMIFTVGPEASDLIRANRFYVEPTESPAGMDNDEYVGSLTKGDVRS